MNYKKAFKCSKCPQCNTEKGCPMWWEIVMTNNEGEVKVEKGCGYQLMPLMILEGIKAADHSTAAAYDMRNRVVESVGKFLTTTAPPRIEEHNIYEDAITPEHDGLIEVKTDE